MAKGKKKTRGLGANICALPWKEPTPQERTERAAQDLLREAVMGDPKFKATAKSIATSVRRGASKLIRASKPRSLD